MMCLWLSLERLWAPFGSLEGAVGPSLGGLWDPFWASWAALGRLVVFIENSMSLSEQMSPKYRACAQKQASQNSPADLLGSTRSSRIHRIHRKRRHPWLVPPWVPHAPGARMTVVNTNSLK